jgi:putative transposase
MKDDKLHELALFKFSLIAPVVNGTYQAVSKMQYYREVASKIHTLPDGKQVRISSNTIKKWYLLYKNSGIDALIPKRRSDIGIPRTFDEKVINKIHDIKEQFPYITGKLVYQKLIEEGYIKQSTTSMSSVHRYLRENDLGRKSALQVERRAYEMEFANDCWQADTSVAATIKVDGIKRKTYLVLTIDDASRIITHGEFFFNDNALNMQKVFKKSILKFGLPKRLFVDNGSPFKNNQLRLICASLGVVLIHTKPYSAASKGKVERVFRTLKDNWLNAVDWNEFDSLKSLNDAFYSFLNEKYMNTVHSSIGMSPRERYLKDHSRIKFVPKEILDEHFLHRVTRTVNNDATIKLHSELFEVPQKYIRQKINVRYSPLQLDIAYIYDQNNILKDTVYRLKKIDNSRIKRKVLDYSIMKGDGNSD